MMDLWLFFLVAILVAVIGLVVFLPKKQPTPVKVPVQTQMNPQLEGAYAVKRNDQMAKQQFEDVQQQDVELETAEELTPEIDEQIHSFQSTLQQLRMKSNHQPSTIQYSKHDNRQMLLQQVQQMNREAKGQQKQLYTQLQRTIQQATQLLHSIDESVQSMETLTTLTEQLEQTEQQLQQSSK